ncbi:hypothetical protein [Alicyclobacillus sp. ALC3]|uniref:hypothetical protein n=1 Tax=Alicyclobacillus sp. ALC3 TaxID=2796143 RepID=UPI0023789FE7|nr:hypothetical protein [Alicyclobacillus sp. ALC3]WDL95693.1 hypothetical protein JC200_15100 [Alicyclobacillus sp. ALC3]
MSLEQWTFRVAVATAAVGLALFAGFGFRIKAGLRFLFVTLHVVGATSTVIMFCVLFVRWMRHPAASHSYAGVILWVSLIVILATFLSGMYFYFFYNVRRRRLHYPLLVSHLIMAALSFFCVMASVAELSPYGLVKSHLFLGHDYNFQKHEQGQHAQAMHR